MLRIDRMLQCTAILPLLGLLGGGPRQAEPAERPAVSLTSVAYRVHRTAAMVAFYTEAFEGFPVHQLGFEVPDVAAVIATAERHGGRVQDPPERRDGRVHAAVRDPDGNTIELYGRR